MSTLTTVRARSGRTCRLYSELEMASSRSSATVVKIWPKATVAFLPLISVTSPAPSCPLMRTLPPTFTSSVSAAAAGPSTTSPWRALRSRRCCWRRSTFSISRSIRACCWGVSVRPSTSFSRNSSSSRRAKRVISFSACASLITRMVFSICLLASATSARASSRASCRMRLRSCLMSANWRA